MTTAVITGSASGLGAELYSAMLDQCEKVIGWDIKTGVDITKKASLRKAVKNWPANMGVDILINCAGVNELNWFKDLQEETWDKIMNVNAKTIYLVTQHLLPRLRRGTVLNIISSAAQQPMRASLAYNASKAAAYMMTKQMARELWNTHQITVFGVSPNRLKGTAMSNDVDKQVAKVRNWSPQEVIIQQRKSLPVGEETPPMLVAELIAFLLREKDRHHYLHGSILHYGE